MLLTIDVGNTNMVFGVFQNGRLTNSFRLVTGATRTSDEIGLQVREYFQCFGLEVSEVEDVIICSVVPRIMHSLNNAVIKYFNRTPIVINQDVTAGLRYSEGCQWRSHGADRSVACVSALEKYGAPLIVLDFGTATTVDCMDRDGVYQGGSILAGIQISMNALISGTAQLPQVELQMPETVLCKDTVSQIQSGVMQGYIGAMERLIARSRAELDCEGEWVKVVATGGLARLIAANSTLIDVVDGNLIPDGLHSIYQKYRSQGDRAE
ncbi:MAG: type III pantothenate kinase [Clostridiales bacterium]|nr:type III pantothenate kinase [Clostridiales bacterium]